MKKVLLVAFGIFFYSISINAQESEIINKNQEIEFQICQNPNIEIDNFFCSAQKTSIRLDELMNKNLNLTSKGYIGSSYYNCFSLPLFHGTNFRIRGQPFLKAINSSDSPSCDLIVNKEYVVKLVQCLNNNGEKWRQKCVDRNNIVVLKPAKKFIFKRCENEILEIRTHLITLDNAQQCPSLNKFNPSWKNTKYWTRVDEEDTSSEPKYEFVFFLDYINDTSNRAEAKKREEEAKQSQDNILKPISKPEF